MDLLTANDRPGRYPPSYYATGVKGLPNCTAAQGQISCDVCVVGGGYTGLSTALHLAQRGYKVHLLEAQRIGFGASGRNGGQVGQGQRIDQISLEKRYGRDRAAALWQIGRQALDKVRALSETDAVRTQFHPGLLHLDHRARYVPHTEAYVRHLQDRYGEEAITFLDKDAARQLVGSTAYHGGLRDQRAGHIDPLQFALGLGRLAQRAGAVLHEQSRVIGISPGKRPVVKTDRAQISCDYVVLGCNGYLGDLSSAVARHVMPINNYIIATAPLAPALRASVLRENLAVADSKFVVNYFRLSSDHRLLFGGSESYGDRFASNIAAKVRRPMVQIFPQLAQTRIDYAWGGTLAITRTRLPDFRRVAGNIFSMSGYSGHGLALGTLAGEIAAEAIAGQAERFDIMAQVVPPAMPGGARFRLPLLTLAMLWYRLRDRM
ncbi:FAD-binding oxidoreductase [Cognatishimia sp. SS12]|uniref:NAD(P)/FAD-dependent oxidoreductase n=1 Tax=Cognatishimia sp. SS12 TaxID=2979465 RepID=UPI00232E4869|nr:FAD-binding oxidoreductase [Cognatishimia sp. SS12]MDC0738673.1 FAD-binding oxidoreductase [Cognatishimia sp. SS12]